MRPASRSNIYIKLLFRAYRVKSPYSFAVGILITSAIVTNILPLLILDFFELAVVENFGYILLYLL